MTAFIRLENAAIALALMIAYFAMGGTWTWFLILILVPDVFMVWYAAGPKVGAYAYNLAHTWIGAILLVLAGWYLDHSFTVQVALIWGVHISADRALGYGLKLSSGFKDTHLGRIGR